MTLPLPAPLTVSQIVAIYNAVGTDKDLTAAHAECLPTLSDDERGRVVLAEQEEDEGNLRPLRRAPDRVSRTSGHASSQNVGANRQALPGSRWERPPLVGDRVEPRARVMSSTEISDSQARRAAKRIGLFARKSRWRRDTIDNYGGYMLIDPWHNSVVAGSRFDLTAADVVEWCIHDPTAA
jgi:hypothetical protein